MEKKMFFWFCLSFKSYILIAVLILSCFFSLFLITQCILGNFSKFTVEITLSTSSFHFSMMIKYFCVSLNCMFSPIICPLLDHSHLVFPSTRFRLYNNLCIKCSSTCFYIISSYLSIIFQIPCHILKEFFNSEDVLDVTKSVSLSSYTTLYKYVNLII